MRGLFGERPDKESTLYCIYPSTISISALNVSGASAASVHVPALHFAIIGWAFRPAVVKYSETL